MTLSNSVEKTIRNKQGAIEHQELRISATANSKDEAEDLTYEDFKLELIINGTTSYDLSLLLSKAGLFQDMVDDKDWSKEYAECVQDARDVKRIAHFENY